MSKQRMTTVRLELLSQIKQEQAWAEAQEVSLQTAIAAGYSGNLHFGHRNIALATRDRLLAAAPQIVRDMYFAYMADRIELYGSQLERLEAIEIRVAEIAALEEDRARERHANHRSYRSRDAHSQDAMWQQERLNLLAEKAALDAIITHNPILCTQ